MNTQHPAPGTSDAQIALLHAPIGMPGSGAMRYGAAMFFYTLGQMPVEMLEIYRCCSKSDREDPIDLARFEGIVVPAFAVPPRSSQRA